MADCFNPKSNHYKKSDCKVFEQDLRVFGFALRSSCLNPRSMRYATSSCILYRKRLYAKLLLSPPKVKRRSVRQIESDPAERPASVKLVRKQIPYLTNSQISYAPQKKDFQISFVVLVLGVPSPQMKMHRGISPSPSMC